ncbi:alpha/beta hydrolase [Clostridium sp. B9]|uniref:alpha/beta hydrolase n=1 Tax=Clostridium sp. B9 TaxID=3423224 RepID=UPI003D2F3145
MTIKNLYYKAINVSSNIMEKLTTCNVAVEIYKIIFQLGVFPKPKNYKKIIGNLNIEENLDYESSIDNNNKLDIYYPKNTNGKLPVIMWIHGGGYISNSKETVKNYMLTLANEGFVVVNIDYALSPKYRYPSQIIQSNDALNYVFENIEKYNGDKNKIFIGGDSAGAQIASQLGALISNRNFADRMNIEPSIKRELLKGIVLFCGLYDMDTVRATKFPGIQTYMQALTGTKEFEKYEKINELSTIKNITKDYPNTFITVGDADPFEIQSKELSSELVKLGVKVKNKFFKDSGLWHEYQFKLSIPEAKENFESLVEFIEASA